MSLFPASRVATENPPAEIAFRRQPISTTAAFLSGLLTAFTVSLVGEMPVGEVILMMVAAWTLLCVAFHHTVPGDLLRLPYLKALLIGEAIALAAYIVSDFMWGSSTRDMMRGWGRLVFLAIDVIAVAYLFGRSRRNLLVLLAGVLAGDLAYSVIFGARFDDTWKFGYAIPLTYAVIFTASFLGPAATAIVAAAMAVVHFKMDFRSMGGLCLLLSSVTAMFTLPRAWRRIMVPVGAVAGLALVFVIYSYSRAHSDAHRSTRSDVDRQSMVQAAAEGFYQHPLKGNGSWFSRSDVYENYAQIREYLAKEAGVGGFSGPNEGEPEAVGIHSQILVALAEGGILGGSFFFVYAWGLAWAVYDQVLRTDWVQERAVRLLMLFFGLWHLLLSPFSGAHRVYIAMAAGLILIVMAERRELLQARRRSEETLA